MYDNSRNLRVLTEVRRNFRLYIPLGRAGI